jgi:hypothetical protein
MTMTTTIQFQILPPCCQQTEYPHMVTAKVGLSGKRKMESGGISIIDKMVKVRSFCHRCHNWLSVELASGPGGTMFVRDCQVIN